LGRHNIRELDASVAASGPHDFAVRNNISRPLAVDRSRAFRQPALQPRRAQNAAASTAFHPAFRDDRDTPLLWGGMGRVLELIWGPWEQKYFRKIRKKDSTTNSPTGKSLDRAVQAATRKISDFLIVLQGGGHRVAVANDPPAKLAVTNRNGLDTPVTDPGQLYPGAGLILLECEQS
jgi:hypothetical protein